MYSLNNFDLRYKNNNALFKLIYLNLAIFIGLKVALIIPWALQLNVGLFNAWVLDWFGLPTNLGKLIVRPWTFLTYAFTHFTIRHILSNMLILYFLGRIFAELLGERRIWNVFISGSLMGGLFSVLAYNIIPALISEGTTVTIGASAGVMAVMVAAATYAPNYTVRFFVIDVRLKYIALIFFLLDTINVPEATQGSNIAHIAHIGGAILGFWFARRLLKDGKDITQWVGYSLEVVKQAFQFKQKPGRRSRMKVKYKQKKRTAGASQEDNYRQMKADEQEQIDAILDKISKSGYDSLSKAEKEFLFKQSNQK